MCSISDLCCGLLTSLSKWVMGEVQGWCVSVFSGWFLCLVSSASCLLLCRAFRQKSWVHFRHLSVREVEVHFKHFRQKSRVYTRLYIWGTQNAFILWLRHPKYTQLWGQCTQTALAQGWGVYSVPYFTCETLPPLFRTAQYIVSGFCFVLFELPEMYPNSLSEVLQMYLLFCLKCFKYILLLCLKLLDRFLTEPKVQSL